MKRIVIVSIMILAAASVFATGNQEVNENGVVELSRGALAQNSYLDNLDKVELKGVVKYDSPVAELVSGGKDYTLIAPGVQMFAGYVSEGQKITVKGYILEDDSAFGYGMGRQAGPGFSGSRNTEIKALEGNINLLVESVEIDGTVYQLPWVDGENFGQNSRFNSGFGRQGSRRMDNFGRGGFMNEACPIYN